MDKLEGDSLQFYQKLRDFVECSLESIIPSVLQKLTEVMAISTN